MTRYTDEERAEAVALLAAEGYPDQTGALTRTSHKLGIPARTLRRWFKGHSNPPPDKIVRQKKGELVDMLRDEVYAIMGVLPGKRLDAGYRELVTALGIMFDKMRLIDGDATERVEISLDDKRQDLERRIARFAAGNGADSLDPEPDE